MNSLNPQETAHESIGARKPTVLIAVLTYRRPLQLRICIESISRAVTPSWVAVPHLLVVDNDPSEDRIHLARGLSMPSTVLKVGYGRGIAAARQAALDYGRKHHYDYISFVDDDEIVSALWLSNLLNCAAAENATAVSGPVLAVGLKRGQLMLHMRARHQTGTVVESAGAGNLLLDISATSSVDFDTTWSLSGGEDTEYTMRLSKEGHSIVWCDEAIVTEPVLSSRLGFGWLTKRFFQNGRILARSHMRVSKRFSMHAQLRAPVAILVVLMWPVHGLSPSLGRFILEKGVRQLGYVFEMAYHHRAKLLELHR